jgi:hypothetical protein
MAPTLMAVAVTPGALEVDPPDVVDDEAAVVVVVEVVEGEDEHPATTTAIPNATAHGTTQFPRCSPMTALSRTGPQPRIRFI